MEEGEVIVDYQGKTLMRKKGCGKTGKTVKGARWKGVS